MYARTVGDQTLTLQVSGMLWNRSLIMRDLETKSLWSHILGKAMDGPLKDKELEPLPAEMVTWKKWRTAHPNTTVLDMSRTHRAYNEQFYAKPERFVVGVNIAQEAGHVRWTTMIEHKVINASLNDAPLLIVYDSEGAAARVFDRRIKDRTLTFERIGGDRLRDRETKTLWDAFTGEAVKGPLAGEALRHRVAIPSLGKAWLSFHPKSTELKP